MSSPLVIDLFAEDAAHEALLGQLVRRVAGEEGRSTDIRTRVAQGGHGRVMTEFRSYQRLVVGNVLTTPDLMVVAIDANCRRFNQASREIEDATDPSLQGIAVTACPDPHVERWYMADPESFCQVVGAAPVCRQAKCVRDYYKAALGTAIHKAGHPAGLGGIEFARDLVAAMDLFRAGRNERSLKSFLDQLQAGLRRLPQS
jgi:hypothetical protein